MEKSQFPEGTLANDKVSRVYGGLFVRVAVVKVSYIKKKHTNFNFLKKTLLSDFSKIVLWLI